MSRIHYLALFRQLETVLLAPVVKLRMLPEQGLNESDSQFESECLFRRQNDRSGKVKRKTLLLILHAKERHTGRSTD